MLISALRVMDIKDMRSLLELESLKVSPWGCRALWGSPALW